MYFTTINNNKNKEKTFSSWQRNNNTGLRAQRSQTSAVPLSQERRTVSSAG